MKTKFTTEEIKEWLEGWFIAGQYEDGRRKGLSLESILALLECDQDGIEAYFERKTWVNDEQQKGDKIGWDKERCDKLMEWYQRTRPVGEFL